MTPDGKSVLLTFSCPDGSECTLAIESDALANATKLIIPLLSHTKSQQPGLTSAIDATGFGAMSAQGETKLIVTFVTGESLEHHFAIPTDIAPELRKRILEAEKKNKKQNRPTRH